MRKKRVLITGSNGLLGQKLTDLYLHDTRVEFLATGKGPSRHSENLKNRYAEMDITNPEQVMYVVSHFDPDTIVHTAAMTNVDACETQRALCDTLNVKAVDTIVDAANWNDAHLILLSTDFIFDGTSGPYKEDDLPNPLSYYGHSKLNAESIVRAKCNEWSIVRTALVYGVSNDMSRSNIVLWAKDALDKRKPIQVVDDQFRSPTLAEDLAQGCVFIEEQKARGIYNISGKDFINIYELVEKVAKVFNLSTQHVQRIKSDTLNQPAKRPPVTGFDITKAVRELGYSPHSIEEGIRMVVDQTIVKSDQDEL